VFEGEVRSAEDAAFFMANEVVNEYHSFPIVQRADIGGANCMFIQINGKWFQMSFGTVYGRRLIERLEGLAENE
jgi:hypothetical protein